MLLGDRVIIHPRKGLTCMDNHQSDYRCADYKVRFYCPGMYELCRKRNETTEVQDNTEHPNRDQSNDINKTLLKKQGKHKNKLENEIIVNSKKQRRQKPSKSRKDKSSSSRIIWPKHVTKDVIFHRHLYWNNKDARYQARLVQTDSKQPGYGRQHWRIW